MASAPLAIEITARLDKFRTEMAKIPDIGGKEAKALTAQLSREIKAATKAAEQAAKANKGAKASTDDFGASAGRAGSNIQKMSGFLDSMVPGLGRVTQAGADAFDVIEVGAEAASAFGVAAVGLAGGALVALAASYAVVTRGIEEERAATESARVANDSLEPTIRAVTDANLDLAVALGTVTQAQADQIRTALGAQRGVQDFAESQREQKRAIEETIESADRWRSVLSLGGIMPNIFADAADATFGWSEKIETANAQLDVLDRAVTTEAGNQKVLRKELQAATAATEAQKDADDRAKSSKDRLREATEAQVKALTAAIKASEEEAKANTDARDSIEAIRKVGDDATQSALKGEDLVISKRDKTLAQLQAMYQASVALQNTDSGRLMAGIELARAQVDVEEAAQVEITEIRKEEGKKREDLAKKEAKAQQRYAVSAVQGSADLMGAISSLAANAQDGMTKEQKEAAKVLFGVQLAAGIAQATINAALAVSEAQASAPYPYNIPAIAAATVAGAANVAAIASTPAPTFSDTPGPVMAGNGVGRTSVNVSAGDMVVASRTKEGLRAQVDPYAKRTDGANVTIINRRTFGATVRDDVRVNSPLARLSASSPTALGFR